MPAWKGAKEVPGEDDISDLPEPKATKQYKKSIGPQQLDPDQYEKPIGPNNQKADQYNKPIGPEKEGIFKRAVRAINPDLPDKAVGAGKNFPKNVKQKGITVMENLGRNVGAAAMKMNGPPVWLRDTGGKGKATQRRVKDTGLPDWVLGRGTPWDGKQSHQGSGPAGEHGRVTKVVVTRHHEDGTVTRSYRKPKERKSGSGFPGLPY